MLARSEDCIRRLPVEPQGYTRRTHLFPLFAPLCSATARPHLCPLSPTTRSNKAKFAIRNQLSAYHLPCPHDDRSALPHTYHLGLTHCNLASQRRPAGKPKKKKKNPRPGPGINIRVSRHPNPFHAPRRPPMCTIADSTTHLDGSPSCQAKACRYRTLLAHCPYNPPAPRSTAMSSQRSTRPFSSTTGVYPAYLPSLHKASRVEKKL